MQHSLPSSSQASCEKLGEYDDDRLDEDKVGSASSSNNNAAQITGESQPSGHGPDFLDIEKHADANAPDAPGDDKNAFEVRWAEGDRSNPRNFSTIYKGFITWQLGMLALAASLGSSIIAPAEPAISRYTGVSQEITVLCVALYVLGFAFGPLLWGPVSEVYGRKLSILPAMYCLGLFSIGTAVSKNAASVFITRFFSGVFGSAPVSNVSAALGDMYDPSECVYANRGENES
jgi:hypothetical protein